MITNYEHSDFDLLKPLFLEFFKESPYESFDFEVLEGNLVRLKSGEDFLGLVAWEKGKPIGFIFAITQPLLFSKDRVSSELAWFVTKSKRNTKTSFKLFNYYEYWSKNISKANFVSMATLSHERLGEIYKKRGYNKIEDCYLKRNS